MLDGGFDTLAPVLKILLLDDAPDEVIAALTAAEVDSVRVEVEVTGMKTMILENDFGRLDPAKVFMPFGPSPKVGSSFYVNAEEAFVKDVTSVKFHLLWNNPPLDFKRSLPGIHRPFGPEREFQRAFHCRPRGSSRRQIPSPGVGFSI